MIDSYKLDLFADYHQFYLQDENAEDQEIDWTTTDLNRLLLVVPGVIFVGTVRNMTVPVTLNLVESKPSNLNHDDWDQVNGIQFLFFI